MDHVLASRTCGDTMVPKKKKEKEEWHKKKVAHHQKQENTKIPQQLLEAAAFTLFIVTFIFSCSLQMNAGLLK